MKEEVNALKAEKNKIKASIICALKILSIDIFPDISNNTHFRRKETCAKLLATTWPINEPSKTALITGKLVSFRINSLQRSTHNQQHLSFAFSFP